MEMEVNCSTERITPACAGKSHLRPQHALPQRDHPRMCGEKEAWREVTGTPEGSPPHVRGKAKRYLLRVITYRITPACAGKRARAAGSTTHFQDHPRMCGEKQKDICYELSRIGSPPHVRGKEQKTGKTRIVRRITPACAGKRLKNVIETSKINEYHWLSLNFW